MLYQQIVFAIIVSLFYNRIIGPCEVRLVTILPDQFSHTIRCSLQYRDLDDAGPYHALSYTWGDEKHQMRFKS